MVGSERRRRSEIKEITIARGSKIEKGLFKLEEDTSCVTSGERRNDDIQWE